MRHSILALPLAAILLAAPAFAQSNGEARRNAELAREAEVMRAVERVEAEQAARLKEAEAQLVQADAEHIARLKEAEAELAEAAAKVAELSMKNLPDMEFAQQVIMDMRGRPRMGVTIAMDSPEKGPVEGVTIIGVTPGSAAADAGLRSGDVITAVNGDALAAEKRYESNGLLMEIMERVDEGDKLDVEYLRDGNVGKVTVVPRRVDESYVFAGPDGTSWQETLRVMPQQMGDAARSWVYRWGGSWSDMELVELSEGLGKYFGTDQGLLVVSAPASSALELEDGDVIQSIDGREPTSVKHALRILGSYQPGEELELSIMRDKRSRKLNITIPDDRTSLRLVEPDPLPVPASYRLPDRQS